ncbi:MAG: hybrid sensor histidine kinase/response regulator, partial [Candidatus Binatia bacterium]
FELCRRLKADPARASTRVLIVTADSDPANVLKGLAAGADAFMTKDHPPGEIVRRVQRTLEGGARLVHSGEEAYSSVAFRGNDYQLRVRREQLLNVLLAAFEDVVDLNERLRASESALRELNQEIRRTNEALAEANKVKDKFLGIAAHDLRNPLGVIRGLAGVLLEGDEGEVNAGQKEVLLRVVRQADAMLALLRDLLDVSTIRAGKLEVNPVLQEASAVMREAFDSFVLAARAKGVLLAWEVADRLPPIEIDFNRVLAVLTNLISNGVKYCTAGRTIRLGADEREGELEIRVEDDGPGIRPEELPKLFEPFARLSSVPTGGEKSTGLGLSIVKEIVELHGGRVSAESVLGRGTTFRVRLPLRQALARR